MGEKKKREWKLPEINLKEVMAKIASRWSVEFSVFLGLVITVFNLGLIDLWLLKAYLGIALTGFFIGVMIKFAIAVYKDCAKAIVESNKCIKNSKKTPENQIKENIDGIIGNIPKVIPIIAEVAEAGKEIVQELVDEAISDYLPGTEPD